MAKSFTYTAVNASGKKHQGVLELDSRADVIRQLQSLGLRPVTITQANSSAKISSKTRGKSSAKNTSKTAEINDAPVALKNKDVVAFTEELSELLEAGLPLEPALASMERRDESGVLQEASAKLRRWITEGEHMYTALSRVSPAFDQLYCNLVKAGEASGSLQMILKQHGAYMKEQMELRARLSQAMIYPGFLVLACVIVTLVFMFYLLPQITDLLTGMPGSEMPLGVVIATGIADFLRNQWIFILIGVIILSVAVKVWSQPEANKEKWDEAKLKLPVVGSVIQYGIYVQWLQTLGNLLSNGVPLVQGLQLTEETVTNRHFRRRLAEVTEGVSDGYRLTRCMRKTEMFPPNMIDLIGVGESTGKLARALGRATEYYDKRLTILIRGVLALISPVILIAMAGLVGLLSYTMIQAIYETMSNLGPKK